MGNTLSIHATHAFATGCLDARQISRVEFNRISFGCRWARLTGSVYHVAISDGASIPSREHCRYVAPIESGLPPAQDDGHSRWNIPLHGG